MWGVMSSDVQAKQRYEHLDVLRGIAVLGVVLVHSQSVFFMGRPDDEQGLGSPAIQSIATIFSSGRLGVEVFFALSGFLIATIYLGREFSLASFFRHRFFRIAPLWLAFGLLWFVVFVANGSPIDSMLEALVLSSIFLLWISPEHFDSFIGGAWSIQIEVFCYAVFAFTRRWSKETLILLAIFVNLLGAAVSSFDLAAEGLLESLRRFSFQTGFNFFLAGWLVGLLRLEFESWQRTREVLSAGSLPFLFITWFGTFLLTPAMYGNPVEALGFVLLALLVTFLSPAFVRGPLRWLGVYSYFIFFSHFLVLYVIGLVVSPTSFQGQSDWLFVPVTVFATVGIIAISAPVAWLSMRYFEKPLQALGRKWDQPSDNSKN